MKKGISLPIETTIVIVLAVVVLVALLFFFSTSVNPGIDRIKLEGQRADLCTKYVGNDRECRGVPSGDTSKLGDVCKSLGTSNVRACCATFCPQITKTDECTAAGGSCLRVACTDKDAVLLGFTGQLGSCNDDKITPICCGK